ncbi:MAG: DUF6265 family protein [Acidobacteriota bacterium]
MRTTDRCVALSCLVLLLSWLAPCAEVSAVRADGQLTLEDLAFLAGCWQGTIGEGTTIREAFTAPLGGLMLGSSQTVADGATVSFEYLRIEETEEGVFYRPSPGGRETVSFQLVAEGSGGSSDSALAVFENLAHDFPQRIVYDLADDGVTLVARIEDESGETSRSFPMTAVPCRGDGED